MTQYQDPSLATTKAKKRIITSQTSDERCAKRILRLARIFSWDWSEMAKRGVLETGLGTCGRVWNVRAEAGVIGI